jgi:glycosyltransferase involved in cell wall biosynthesis
MPVAIQRGGAEQLLLQLLEHGRDLGISWHVTFLEPGPLRDAVEDLGVPTQVIDIGRVRDPLRGIAGLLRLVAGMRARQPDVVLAWMTKAHLYSGTAAALTRTPALRLQHGYPDRGRIDRLADRIPTRGVVVPSRTVAQAQRAVTPCQRIWVAFPGVSSVQAESGDDESPTVLRARYGIPNDAPLVVIVARLQRWKGVHVVVQAVPQLLATRPDLHLVVVGGEHPLEPAYRADLEGMTRALRVDQNVHFTGHQPRPRAWMAAANVVVHASSNEPFGIVVLEALASGSPLVATAGGGPSEIITDGVDGLLVPFGDVPALAASVGRLLADAGLCCRLAAAGRARAAEFTPLQFAQAVADAVRECDAS